MVRTPRAMTPRDLLVFLNRSSRKQAGVRAAYARMVKEQGIGE